MIDKDSGDIASPTASDDPKLTVGRLSELTVGGLERPITWEMATYLDTIDRLTDSPRMVTTSAIREGIRVNHPHLPSGRGTVVKRLKHLEKLGLIETRKAGNMSVSYLTPLGRDALATYRQEVARMTSGAETDSTVSEPTRGGVSSVKTDSDPPDSAVSTGLPLSAGASGGVRELAALAQGHPAGEFARVHAQQWWARFRFVGTRDEFLAMWPEGLYRWDMAMKRPRLSGPPAPGALRFNVMLDSSQGPGLVTGDLVLWPSQVVASTPEEGYVAMLEDLRLGLEQLREEALGRLLDAREDEGAPEKLRATRNPKFLVGEPKMVSAGSSKVHGVGVGLRPVQGEIGLPGNAFATRLKERGMRGSAHGSKVTIDQSLRPGELDFTDPLTGVSDARRTIQFIESEILEGGLEKTREEMRRDLLTLQALAARAELGAHRQGEQLRMDLANLVSLLTADVAARSGQSRSQEVEDLQRAVESMGRLMQMLVKKVGLDAMPDQGDDPAVR